MYYAPKAVFDRIMESPDVPAPSLAQHDSEDPHQCTACLARGGGDIS